MKFKFIEEKIAKLFMIGAATIVIAIVVNIIYIIFKRGLPTLSWDMVSKIPEGGFYIGGDGGILNAIMGSVYIVAGSTVLGLIISIPIVFYINIYLSKKSKLAYVARLSYDILFGIPSIVYGAFAFIIMIHFGQQTSLLGGIIVVTMLIVPILIRSMDEFAQQVPNDLIDSTMALGATKFESIGVLLRQIAPGIATATLLSIGRAIGDAAGVMFTAGFTDNIPTSIHQPAATLPLAVFFQLSSPYEEVQNRAYSSALILILIILVISILGRMLTSRFSKHKL